MSMTKNVTEWRSHIGNFDMPGYYISFGAIVLTAVHLTFDDWLIDMVVPLLFELFSFKTSDKNFLLDDFIPEVPKSITCRKTSLYALITLSSLDSFKDCWHHPWMGPALCSQGQHHLHGHQTALCFCLARECYQSSPHLPARDAVVGFETGTHPQQHRQHVKQLHIL
jgi:hypothetical protein